MNAPPRSSAAPASLVACATSRSCRSLSIEHGPATTARQSPPTRYGPISSTVSWALKSRLASLYGFMMGITFSTPAIPANDSGLSSDSSPIAPMIVRNSPRDTWARRPRPLIRPTTSSTWPSDAFDSMTMITSLLASPSYTALTAAGNEPSTSRCRVCFRASSIAARTCSS